MPDALLLMDPRRNYGQLHKKDILVFTAVDFRPYIEANERLFGYCHSLAFVIAVPEKTPKRQIFYNKLVTAPEVLERMEFLEGPQDE